MPLKDLKQYLKTLQKDHAGSYTFCSNNVFDFKHFLVLQENKDQEIQEHFLILIEDTQLTSYGLLSKGKSEVHLTHFLDGIQRIQLLGYYQMIIPIFIGHVAATVRVRHNKKLSTNSYSYRNNLYLPVKNSSQSPEYYFNLPSKEILSWKSIDTDPNNDLPCRLDAFCSAAINALRQQRSKLENTLTLDWCLQNREIKSHWLCVDGSLMNSSKFLENSQVIGLIKKYNPAYFTAQEQQIILSLPYNHRSSVFKVQNFNLYTWFLRIHNNKNRDLTHGLIRVEIPATEKYLDLVDQISCAIIGETQPSSQPDPRWDKMIYPILDCEHYLKSLAPSEAILKSLS